MGLMSSKIGRDELRPGDHIYTWRSNYSYSHHGIYVGDGKVIHLTRQPGFLKSSSSSQSSDDRVECCDIEDFLCDGLLYRFEYGVSRFEFLMKRPGTCSLASSDPPEQVFHRTSYLLEYGFGNYNLLDRNCEDFAIYCKTGIISADGFSGQIKSLIAAIAAVTFIPYRFLPAGLIGVALWVCGLYCFLRLVSDAGERRDSEVVALEKLAHLSNVHNIRENMNMVENSTPRWFLRHVYYHFGHIAWAIRIWYWTPENTTLLWFKSCLLYILLSNIVSDRLKLHGLKLGQYSAYAIWLLGHLYWRWTSESTILLWTRSYFLFLFVKLYDFDRPQEEKLKLDHYLDATMFLCILWYWPPRIIILQWIKLALVYIYLFDCISKPLRNHGLMVWKAFFVCFVIQSVALFLRLDYSDYVFRMTKITFL